MKGKVETMARQTRKPAPRLRSRTPHGRIPIPFGGKIKWAIISVAALVLLAWASGRFGWIGIESETTEEREIDKAALVGRIKTAELVSTKDTLDVQINLSLGDKLKVGPIKWKPPGWVSGENLDVGAKVQIAAGVSLKDLSEKDITVRRGADGVREVEVFVPEPEVFSAEIVKGTLNMDVDEGLLQKLGISRKHAENKAADELNDAAKQRAREGGTLDQAARDSKEQLERILNAIPSEDGHPTRYIVTVREHPEH